MRNQGSFYISCIGDLVPVPPHLPNDTQRREYLRNKGYFDETLLSDELVAQLSHLNFHHFLGYARNYAMLHNLGIFKGNRDPQHVFDLISLDQKVATLLFAWIRRAELGLRNRTVDFGLVAAGARQMLGSPDARELAYVKHTGGKKLNSSCDCIYSDAIVPLPKPLQGCATRGPFISHV